MNSLSHLNIIESFCPWTGEDRVDTAYAFLIMRRLAVFLQRFRRLEYLVDDKAVVVIWIAQDVKAKVSRLSARALVVNTKRLQKLCGVSPFTLMLTIWISILYFRC